MTSFSKTRWMITAEIERIYNPDNTLGDLTIRDSSGQVTLNLKTVELPWRDNERWISCIPEGTYDVVPRYSKRHKHHFHILGVPDRSLILFHVANYVWELQGCIAPGLKHSDIDGDGVIDVKHSGQAMERLLRTAPDGFTLKIGST